MDTWKYMNYECKKKAIPMQISIGAFWYQIWFWNLITTPRKNWFFWSDLYSSQCIPHLPKTQNTSGRGLIMKPILVPPNVIAIIKPPHSGETGGNLEIRQPFSQFQCLIHSALVWAESLVKHIVVKETEKLGPRTVGFGLRFKQSSYLCSLSEPTTNPQLLCTDQREAWTERRC